LLSALLDHWLRARGCWQFAPHLGTLQR